MKEIILLKCGELVLKGLNRCKFENQLVKCVRYRLRAAGNFKVSCLQSTVYAEPGQNADIDSAVSICKKIFGVVSVCRCAECEKTMEAINETACSYMKSELSHAKTFKVSAKRSDKSFPLTSMDIMRETGAAVLERFPELSVDVHNPESEIFVEVRDKHAYVHPAPSEGAGGLPVGTNGRATILISGGIDSPAAAFLMARRGLELHAVHFFSYPYTSQEAKEKVISLLKIISVYAGHIHLQVVPFTEIQEAIRDNCEEALFTLVMRRFMMRISERLAIKEDSSALITGESLGHVASQTVYALGVTDSVCSLPVLRPLIGMDKKDIIDISRKIGTFEASSLPYEDCCTVFTPRHPQTKPRVKELEDAEAPLPVEELIERALSGVEDFNI